VETKTERDDREDKRGSRIQQNSRAGVAEDSGGSK
jgi:hypothetical protein